MRRPPASVTWRGPVLALALLLAGCGGGDAPRPGAVDLRPRWAPGTLMDVREEKTIESGTGPFPPATEISARRERTERVLSTYRDEVLAADGTRLLRIRRVYDRSQRREGGKTEETPLAGKTYEIEDPFGASRVFSGEPGLSTVPVRGNAEALIRAAAPRIAASLIPNDPIVVGEKWLPGRDPRRLLALGDTGVQIEARLAAVETSEGRRIAWIEGDSVVRASARGQPVSTVTRREKLTLDIDAGRMLAFEVVMEQHTERTGISPETWERTAERTDFTWSTR